MVWFYRYDDAISKVEEEKLSIPLWSDFILSASCLFMYASLIFQSHYGLILSKILSRVYNLESSSFNPTMVWFYRAVLLSFMKSQLCPAFNPTMVWFYLPILFNPETKEYSFQSHYGLILSGSNIYSSPLMIVTFNPTMVWFYHNGLYLFIVRCEAFQSHYGLILSFYSEARPRHETFNPTMVWFYLEDFLIGVLRGVYFQSHYGLILSPARFERADRRVRTFNPTMVWFYLSFSNT